jgi:hypothetical protein
MHHPLLQTFAYATSQKRLLTLEEIYRYQINTQYTLQELPSQIAKIPQIKTQYGLYGLIDCFDELLILRQEKGRESIRRYKQITKYGRLLISIPFIRGIFLAGSSSFSTGNTKKRSDIDIFIITKNKHLWIARFLITSITQILGIRRSGEMEENRFCLNHYITENNLKRSDHNIYSAQLYADYIAIGEDSQQLLDTFWQDNMWTRELFPQAKARQYPIFSHLQSYTIKTWLENILTKFSIHIWNKVARWGQIQKIKSNSIQANKDNRIQVSDTELEFHPEPNSIKVEQAMKQILQQIG